MKFKVGDRVICTRNTCGYATKNKKGTIKKLKNKIYMVDFDENVGGWEDIDLEIKRGHGVAVDDEDLELIEENTGNKQFTLDDLKVGYLVELRYGELHMVMETIKGKILIDKNDLWTDLNSYTNDFYYNNSNRNKTLDIIKVYGFSKNNSKTLIFTTENRELLWKRKEILNGKEKEYLSNFIGPFRNRVNHIKKWYKRTTNNYCIRVDYNDESFDTYFPILKEKDMYKNMEADRAYTLEELEL